MLRACSLAIRLVDVQNQRHWDEGEHQLAAGKKASTFNAKEVNSHGRLSSGI